MGKHPLFPLRWLGAVVLAALLAGVVYADAKPRVLVYTKDGYAIEGYVKRESAEVEVDPYQGHAITFPKGFYVIDDGPRRIAFDTTLLGHIEPMKGYSDERITRKTHFAGMPVAPPSILEVPETSPFNRDWERTMRIRGKDKANKFVDQTVTQQIGMITPYSVRADTTRYFNFSSAYLMHEFSGEEIQALLATHPDFEVTRQMTKTEKLNRRFKFSEFMAQAGFFEQADQEFQRALKEAPDKKDEIEKRMKSVGEIKTREDFEAIKRLAAVGQHQRALKRIETFPEKYANEEMLSKLRELKADYDKAKENGQKALTLLAELKGSVAHAERETFRQAAEQIGIELCYDNINRLDTFLSQTGQYKRLKADGKKTEVGPAELLSLAMSSWLLGSTAGETKPATALRLWKLRETVLNYEKTDDLNLRQKLAAELQKENADPSIVEDAVQIISNLPPVEPAEIDLQPQQVKVGKNTVYELQLPPEYRHGRHYPVLIVLHQGGEKARDMLNRWRDAAADNGYILAAPQWESGNAGYTFGDREHQSVLDTLRDLRRRYRVDSDRVFLFGLRDGAVMAFDVGLSHPDLFAGVSTMGAAPEKYGEIYWPNAQVLPFYVVNGDRVGPLLDKAHTHFEHWIDRHFASLWIQYKGRGAEWFGGEVPLIFEWMRIKRRAFPLHHLGDGGGFGGTEFTTMRPTDNSFYWLTTANVPPQIKSRVQATIYPESNEIRVTAVGLKQVSVWLGRNLRGESMIDFARPVSFRVNNTQIFKNMQVKPSLALMLEDLYRRADRQRVYMAKIDWPSP